MIEPIDPQFLPSVSQSAGDQLVIEVDPDVSPQTLALPHWRQLHLFTYLLARDRRLRLRLRR
jgi:hypothetical protein